MASISRIILNHIENGNEVDIPTLRRQTGCTAQQIYSAMFYLDKTSKIHMVKDGWNSTARKVDQLEERKKKVTLVTMAPEKQTAPVDTTQKSFSDEASELFFKHFGSMAASIFDEKIAPIFERKLCELSEKLAEKFAADIEHRTSVIIADALCKTQLMVDNVGLQEPTKEAIPPTVEVTKPVKNRLRKVCVLGLKPNQQGSIAAEYGQTFDLVFWNDSTGSSFTQLQQLKNSCEAFFIHTNHVGHNAQENLKGCKIIFCGGGTTHMKQKLREYYEAEVLAK